MKTCDYCGHEHHVRELCRARGVSRRRFLFLGLGAAAAAVLPMPSLSIQAPVVAPVPDIDALMRSVWEEPIRGMVNSQSGLLYLLDDAVYRPGEYAGIQRAPNPIWLEPENLLRST